MEQEQLEMVFHYHQQTKHQLERYAKGPGYMDWANQPNPFREYDGAHLYDLDLTSIEQAKEPKMLKVLTGQIVKENLSFATISQLFRDSLSLSSWKSYRGNKWALRCNPSSGNLHPTEGYLIAGPIPGLSNLAGVYHYRPKDHALELRASIPDSVWSHVPKSSFFIGFSSIHWREAWKYGERAFRYCQHDVGHAIEAMTISAGGLGWSSYVLDDLVTSDDLKSLLGLDRRFPESSNEEPDCLMLITSVDHQVVHANTLRTLIEASKSFEWRGVPNRLSASELPWKIIDEASKVTEKHVRLPTQPISSPINSETVFETNSNPPLRHIIHQRRSAVDFDAEHEPWMTSESFYQILRSVQRPFTSLPWEPQIHLVLFVHRVQGMDQGVYFLIRNPTHLDDLKANTDKDYLWLKPVSCPDDITLYQLAYGDAREVAKTVSCHQDIAADGSFSVGMIARFQDAVREKGAWFYRRLFWETGMIGQRLYLQAEAIQGGFRGTGIGCFFDDSIHSVLGFPSTMKYQSLYHFTIGYPIIDERLSTLKPYAHLEERKSAL